MIKELTNFEHKKQAHLKKIKKSKINDIESDPIAFCKVSQYLQTLTIEQIIGHLQKLIQQKKQLNRVNAKYIWERLVSFKEQCDNYKNKIVFKRLSQLIGSQINSKTYYLLKKKGRDQFRIEQFQTVKLIKKRKCRNYRHKNKRTTYEKLKLNGVQIAKFLKPETHNIQPFQKDNFEEYLRCSFQAIIDIYDESKNYDNNDKQQ